MNKLTLVSLALLCLLFTACSETELNIPVSELALESRTADPISVKYVNGFGQNITVSGTRLEVSYINGSTADLLIEHENGSTTIGQGNSLQLNVAEGYKLEVAVDQNASFEATDLFISGCISELCYNDLQGNHSGTALDFIIEDVSEGF